MDSSSVVSFTCRWHRISRVSASLLAALFIVVWRQFARRYRSLLEGKNALVEEDDARGVVGAAEADDRDDTGEDGRAESTVAESNDHADDAPTR